MKDFTNYLFRCHAAGKLMTGVKIGLTPNQEETFTALDARYKGTGKPLTEKQTETYFGLGAKRTAKPTLSATAKTYLDDIFRLEYFGRSNHLQSKFLDKGLMVEHVSATLYSEVSGKPIFKNKERKTNEYLTGTADNAYKKIRDIKSSWSLESFPLLDDEMSNNIYDWQLQGYMDLWNMDEAELIYCLVDTPFNLVEDEIRRLSWKADLLTFSGEIKAEAIPLVVELVQNHIFTSQGLKDFCHQSPNVQHDWFTDFMEIPADMRVKIFEVQRSKEAIEALYEQIRSARTYLNSLSNKLNQKLLSA